MPWLLTVRRASHLGGWLAAVSLALGMGACRGPKRGSAPTPPDGDFVDVADATGLDFAHRSGRSGGYYIPEILGAGAAFLDFDNDGDLDVYLVQGGRLQPPGDASGRSSEPRGDRLFRNELVPSGVLRFTDVTARSGIAVRGYGQGVAVGDYDNDGRPDLYVTSFGPSQLLHNQGDGTFREVTESAGAGSSRWSTSASFVDFDRDGWLDLYVADYVDYTLTTDRPCPLPGGRRDYCGPLTYHPLPHRLLRNRGDGTFEDVSERSHIRTALGNGLGVVAADFDGDGWPDLYVANDQTENFLWMNQKDGTFRNAALLAGAALSGDGSAEGSMGVDAGDVDGDGDEDLFFTNLTGQKNTLYVNDGHGSFTDQSLPSGLGRLNQWGTGFGAGLVDYDNDGWLDALLVNGTVLAIDAQLKSGDPLPYKQPGQLFRNLGGGRFQDASGGSGALQVPGVSRAAAFGDVDNDGDVDVLVTGIDGQARLLVNQVGSKRPWLGVRLMAGKRDALGARVVLRRPDGPALARRVHADGSYCSASDPRVVFGLGAGGAAGVMEVSWPDGRRERFRELPAGRYTTLAEGRGEALR
jgi:enediyne biosynthesis protein E4